MYVLRKVTRMYFCPFKDVVCTSFPPQVFEDILIKRGDVFVNLTHPILTSHTQLVSWQTCRPLHRTLLHIWMLSHLEASWEFILNINAKSKFYYSFIQSKPHLIRTIVYLLLLPPPSILPRLSHQPQTCL